MEQMTLWEQLETTKSAVNPTWEQLDPVAKMDVLTKLSRLMTKAVNPNHNIIQNEQENNNEQ